MFLAENRMKMLLFIAVVFMTIFISSPLFARERSVIIVFNKQPGPVEVQKLTSKRGKVKRHHPMLKAISVALPEEEISKVKNDPHVAYVEEDVRLSLLTPLMSESEYTNSWGVGHIGALSAHEAGIKGKGVKIAVLDTGIDYMHQELAGNYKGGYDFVFDDNDPYDDGYNSHGTHVSGIIASAINGSGIAGVAPEASIYAVKVLDGAGFGMLSDIIAGIEWSVANGMDIVNLSFGSMFYFKSPEDTCNMAYEKGLLLVAATGNSRGGEVAFPARHSSVIGVSAIDSENLISNRSAIGPEVELVAPGINILSTMAAEKGNFGYLHGSSQAAPYVAGTAALLLSSGRLADLNENSLIDHEDIRLAMAKGALDLGESGFDELYGHGMVRVPGFDHVERLILVAEKSKKKALNGYELNFGRGIFRLDIQNTDLIALKILLMEKINDQVVNKKTHVHNFLEKGDDISFTADFSQSEVKLYLYPLGKEGTTAEVRLVKK